VGAGMTGRKNSTPTLILPPQGGGDIRIEIVMTIKIASGLCPSQ